jgi:peptide/nickel transport system substrate-binding protein
MATEIERKVLVRSARRNQAFLAPIRVLALSLGLALLTLLSGCGGQGEGDATLRMALANPPRNLDPRLATDATSERINRLLYRRLVEFDAASLPAPSLATWEVLTPTHYRFTLGGEGRTFSDGTRLAAEDVAATYASILDPATASPHRALLGIIADVRANGPDGVDFLLREPDPLFPAYLGIGILPAPLIRAGHPFHHRPVGSGPFALDDWSDPGRLRLSRRRDGRSLELVAVKDPNVRVMKLLRGEVQMLQNDLSPELIGFLSEGRGVQVSRGPGVNFSYLGFNLENADTGRPQVRQALAHAIDRAAILRHLFRGGGRLANGLFPPGHWAAHAGLEGRTHDPERARALLAAAGYGPGQPLRLTLKTSSDPFRVRLATVIQAQLRAVGVDLQVQSYDWGTFFGDIQAGRFQLYGLTWVGIRNPDIFRYAFASAAIPPDGANRGRYRSPEADRLIATARAEPDLGRQAVFYRELAALLLEDLPYIPLWYEDQVFASRTGISGYHLALDGNYDALDAVEWDPAPRGSGARGNGVLAATGPVPSR